MNIYLVREAGTTKIHGVFWANNPAELWEAVDEMSDPSAFEFAKIREPGGIWHEMPMLEVLPSTQSGEDGHILHPLTLPGEHLCYQIFSQSKHKWTRFDYADEGVGILAQLKR